MPNYDYKCTQCGHIFEVFQNMTDKHLESCPKCRGKLKRLIGKGSGPIFKGSGFYQTDYKNKSSANSSKPASAPKSSDTKTDTKKDTKTDTKTETKKD